MMYAQATSIHGFLWCWCIVVIIKIGVFLKYRERGNQMIWYDDKMSATTQRQKINKMFNNLLLWLPSSLLWTVRCSRLHPWIRAQKYSTNTFRKLNQKVSSLPSPYYLLALNMLNFTLRICWRFLWLTCVLVCAFAESKPNVMLMMYICDEVRMRSKRLGN